MKTHLISLSARTLLVGTVLTLFTGTTTLAASRAQWYDPTDWFDPQSASKLKSEKSDVYDLNYDYGLGENFDYAIWSTYGSWGTDIGARAYDSDYWEKQKWSSSFANLGTPSGKTLEFDVYPTSSRRARGSSESVRRDSKSDESSSSDIRSRRNNRSERADRTTRSERSSPGSSSSKSGDNSGGGDSSSEGSDRVAHLEGTLQGLTAVQLRRESGATGTYVLAKVRLKNGEDTVAALGRDDQLEKLDLEKGSKIEAVGRRGTVDDESLFVAHRLKSGTVTIDAVPTIRLADDTVSNNAETRTGTLGQVRTTSGNTWVELKLDNGKSAWLDLGPAASLTKIGLETGERVTVRGTTRAKDNARDVITASLLKIDDGSQSTASDEE